MSDSKSSTVSLVNFISSSILFITSCKSLAVLSPADFSLGSSLPVYLNALHVVQYSKPGAMSFIPILTSSRSHFA